MLLKYFYDKTLAQASYMVGCAATGEALVVDASRDIAQYIETAEAEGLRITHVTETHIHADYVSGSHELSAATGATMYLSDEGDENWKYGLTENVVQIHNGDMWMVGNIRVDVIHTPGHTPESVSFMITDTAGADKPMGIFTGDFLFVGDVGRPDLLDEAAGFVGTREPGARLQYKNVEYFKTLPDYLQIWPAHGAGSACGKALGAIPSSTLGYEKLFNPAFQFDNEQDFVDWLLTGQPEAPKYFARMKYVNKVGPELLKNAVTPQKMDASELAGLIAEGATIIDIREGDESAAGFVNGVLTIPLSAGSFSTYVGWFAAYDKPLYLIANEDQVAEAVRQLQAIGYDNIPGYFAASEAVNGNAQALPQIDAQGLQERMAANGMMLLDVRGATEYAEAHIPGATNIPLGYIPRHIEELDKSTPIVTQCVSGLRSQIAASLLRRYGFEQVTNLTGGFNSWAEAGLSTESE
jgi:hydroxyacylglutathione hydrolase